MSEIVSIKKFDIRDQFDEGLASYMEGIGEQPFRTKQVHQWLWQKCATSFDDMTNLSRSLRAQLSKDFEFNSIEQDAMQQSVDETIKVRFKLHDGKKVEGVLIPSMKRVTACISSQAGCSLNCSFCATGYMGLQRNLRTFEIFDQVVQLRRLAENTLNKKLSNIVYMGMGEPLLNYKNVVRSIELLTSPEGLGISSKRITLSTAGIAKMIKRLADDSIKVNLAVSLHAATDEKRTRIMPINAQNSLNDLGMALKYYYDKTGGQITYEYILLKNINDSISDAKALEKFCKIVPAKINIIEYNPIAEASFESTGSKKAAAFVGYLEEKEVNVRVRRSRGKDIDGACGQLANK